MLNHVKIHSYFQVSLHTIENVLISVRNEIFTFLKWPNLSIECFVQLQASNILILEYVCVCLFTDTQRYFGWIGND